MITIEQRIHQVSTKSVSIPDPPTLILFPRKNILYVSYGKNGMYIYLTRPAPDDHVGKIMDITDDPLFAPEQGMLIRNGMRYNRIAASYHADENLLIIRHEKRIYSIRIPQNVREINCGGNAYKMAPTI